MKLRSSFTMWPQIDVLKWVPVLGCSVLPSHGVHRPIVTASIMFPRTIIFLFNDLSFLYIYVCASYSCPKVGRNFLWYLGSEVRFPSL
jgi:hypothetical protein